MSVFPPRSLHKGSHCISQSGFLWLVLVASSVSDWDFAQPGAHGYWDQCSAVWRSAVRHGCYARGSGNPNPEEDFQLAPGPKAKKMVFFVILFGGIRGTIIQTCPLRLCPAPPRGRGGLTHSLSEVFDQNG